MARSKANVAALSDDECPEILQCYAGTSVISYNGQQMLMFRSLRIFLSNMLRKYSAGSIFATYRAIKMCDLVLIQSVVCLLLDLLYAPISEN